MGRAAEGDRVEHARRLPVQDLVIGGSRVGHPCHRRHAQGARPRGGRQQRQGSVGRGCGERKGAPARGGSGKADVGLAVVCLHIPSEGAIQRIERLDARVRSAVRGLLIHLCAGGVLDRDSVLLGARDRRPAQRGCLKRAAVGSAAEVRQVRQIDEALRVGRGSAVPESGDVGGTVDGLDPPVVGAADGERRRHVAAARLGAAGYSGVRREGRLVGVAQPEGADVEVDVGPDLDLVIRGVVDPARTAGGGGGPAEFQRAHLRRCRQATRPVGTNRHRPRRPRPVEQEWCRPLTVVRGVSGGPRPDSPVVGRVGERLVGGVAGAVHRRRVYDDVVLPVFVRADLDLIRGGPQNGIPRKDRVRHSDRAVGGAFQLGRGRP